MRPRVLRWWVAAALVAPLFVSCSSGATSASEASSPQQPAPTTASASPSPTEEECGDRAGILPPFTDKGVATVSGASVTLTLSEDANAFFSPSCVVATPGSTLTVVLRNVGTQRHNLTIAGQHIDKDVPVGTTAKVKVKLPRSKPLLFECKYHVAGGMKGAFIPED